VKKYAVVDNGSVVNIIIAETKQDAESASCLTCIEVSPETFVSIGYVYDGSMFIASIPPQPYASWTLGDDGVWIAPVAHPLSEIGYDDNSPSYVWNEESLSWIEE